MCCISFFFIDKYMNPFIHAFIVIIRIIMNISAHHPAAWIEGYLKPARAKL